MQILVQGVTDVGLWTQPGPNPACYSLLPVYRALIGRIFILLAALLV